MKKRILQVVVAIFLAVLAIAPIAVSAAYSVTENEARPVATRDSALVYEPVSQTFYSIGSSVTGHQTDIYRYDPLTDAWVYVTAMPVGCSEGNAVAVSNTSVFVYCGDMDSDKVYNWNPVTDTFTAMSNLPTGLSSALMLYDSVNDDVIVIDANGSATGHYYSHSASTLTGEWVDEGEVGFDVAVYNYYCPAEVSNKHYFMRISPYSLMSGAYSFYYDETAQTFSQITTEVGRDEELEADSYANLWTFFQSGGTLYGIFGKYGDQGDFSSPKRIMSYDNGFWNFVGQGIASGCEVFPTGTSRSLGAFIYDNNLYLMGPRDSVSTYTYTGSIHISDFTEPTGDTGGGSSSSGSNVIGGISGTISDIAEMIGLGESGTIGYWIVLVILMVLTCIFIPSNTLRLIICLAEFATFLIAGWIDAWVVILLAAAVGVVGWRWLRGRQSGAD